MEKCDTSGNGEISKKEAHDCINAHVSKGMQAGAHKFVDQVWDMVDTSGNGEVSEKELAAAMRGPPPALAQGDGSLDRPTVAGIMDKCDANGNGH